MLKLLRDRNLPLEHPHRRRIRREPRLLNNLDRHHLSVAPPHALPHNREAALAQLLPYLVVIEDSRLIATLREFAEAVGVRGGRRRWRTLEDVAELEVGGGGTEEDRVARVENRDVVLANLCSSSSR